MVAIVIRLGEGYRFETLLGDGIEIRRLDLTRLYRRKQPIERNVHEGHVHVQALADFLGEVDLEADDFALLVLRNSHGTLPTFAPTFMSAAEAIVPADIANTAVKVAANVPRRVNFADIWSSILHAVGSIAGDRFSAAVWWPAPWKTCKGR